MKLNTEYITALSAKIGLFFKNPFQKNYDKSSVWGTLI